MTDTAERRGELAAALDALEARIQAACAAAGRTRGEISLIAVTKTFPASDVRLLAELGVTDVGENRDQEAAAKAAELADLDVRWHFVGQVQSRKAGSVARYADVVHSVDRLKIVNHLDRAAADAGRALDVLVQVRLDGPPTPAGSDAAAGPPGAAGPDGAAGATDGRGGVDGAAVGALAEAVAAAAHLRLRGVMAVAPLDADPLAAFMQLGAVAADLRRTHPEATVISAGMSADLDAAVAAGATHLRVGSALLGRRPPLG